MLKTFEISGLEEIHLSPHGCYLLTYYGLQKEEKSDGNMIVWDTKSGEVIGKFLQKSISKETWPFIRWTDDEGIAARRVANEIHFWTGGSVSGAPMQKIQAPNVVDFSLSPGKMNNYFVGVFIGEKKGNPAEVRLYKYPNQRVLASKSFYADTVEFHWSPNGKHLLASAVTHVDRTGRSYYGQSGLYYLSEKADLRVDTNTKKDGPVHTCCWRPDGLQFLSVYGYMPPKTTTFNLKCDPQLEFGTAHRNRAHYSPDGRILWLAGLGGGLTGSMEFWHPTDLKKFGSAEASPSAVHFEWSPDSLSAMTAILSPRMRVDNGFQIWDYHGNLVHKEEFSELLFISYRPLSSKLFPQPPLQLGANVKGAQKGGAASSSSSSSSGNAAPAKVAYRHPNYRGGQSSVRTEVKEEDSKPKKYQAPGRSDPYFNSIPGDTAPPPGGAKKKNRKKKKNPNQGDLPPGY